MTTWTPSSEPNSAWTSEQNVFDPEVFDNVVYDVRLRDPLWNASAAPATSWVVST